MIIEQFCRVSLSYKLSLDDGEVVEDTSDDGPIELVYGSGMIIPGLEQALEGMSPGESKKVSVSPEDGYGERSDDALVMVPRGQFGPEQKLEPGMVFSLQQQDGHRFYATLVETGDEEIKMDFNHPLAGKTLHFDLKVEDVLEPDPNAMAGGGCGCGCGHDHGDDDDDDDCCGPSGGCDSGCC